MLKHHGGQVLGWRNCCTRCQGIVLGCKVVLNLVSVVVKICGPYFAIDCFEVRKKVQNTTQWIRNPRKHKSPTNRGHHYATRGPLVAIGSMTTSARCRFFPKSTKLNHLPSSIYNPTTTWPNRIKRWSNAF